MRSALKRLIVAAASGVALCVFATCSRDMPSNSVAEASGLRLTFSLEVPTVRIGDPVVVVFSWFNQSDRPMAIEAWRGPTSGFSDDGEGGPRDFEVRFSGKRLEYSGAFVCDVARQELTLAPGETVRRTYDVSQVYDFGVTGEYEVRTKYLSNPPLDPTSRGDSATLWCGTLIPKPLFVSVRSRE
jgi:hypothetical protein